jgi:hypothetical protein
MKGMNTIHMNHLTVNTAIEYYLRNVVFTDEVEFRVSQVEEDKGNHQFRVKIVEPDGKLES